MRRVLDPLGPYGIAVLAVIAATTARAALDPLLHDEAPLLIYVMAVLAAGRFGGRGPGIFAAGASLLVGDYLFIEPRFGLLPHAREDYVRLAVFALESIAVVLLTESQRRAYLEMSATAAELARHRQDLEHQVAARTAELKASNDALQAFAYSMSHDLRAPLRAMGGFSRALIEDHGAALPAEGQDYLSRIAAAAVRMDRLIDRLLAYNRLSRSDARLAIAPVKMDSVVTDVLATLRPEIARTNARIDIDERWPVVLGHEEAIAQLLLNLVENGLKFVRRDLAPRVRIWCEHTTITGEPFVKVHVTDNGPGVAPAERDRIFEPFQRVSGTHPGSGLGLAIAAQAAERLGGAVGVGDAAGGGADFWFTVPAAPAGGEQ